MPPKRKERLDDALVRRGLAETPAQARALIMAGAVSVDGARADKSGVSIATDASIAVKSKEHPYVSRGGLKLAAALEAFRISPKGMRCLDVGASTGGFTHCLLLLGAAHVTSLDVGRGQLDASLRGNPRVRVMEGVNARHLDDADLGEPFDLVVMDVSFISVTKIIPRFRRVLAPGGCAVVLIKPQFEVKKSEVGRGGIVRDPALHRRVCGEVEAFLAEEGFAARGMIESPVTGADGNHEFLVCFEPL